MTKLTIYELLVLIGITVIIIDALSRQVQIKTKEQLINLIFPVKYILKTILYVFKIIGMTLYYIFWAFWTIIYYNCWFFWI